MRLKPEQTRFIKATVARHFGEGARVWLFGSRVDDGKRGGDVDLFVEPVDQQGLFDRRARCLGELTDGLPYPVDLIVGHANRELAIYSLARREGILL